MTSKGLTQPDFESMLIEELEAEREDWNVYAANCSQPMNRQTAVEYQKLCTTWINYRKSQLADNVFPTHCPQCGAAVDENCDGDPHQKSCWRNG